MTEPSIRAGSHASRGHGSGLHPGEVLADERNLIRIPPQRIAGKYGPLVIGLTRDAPDETKAAWLTKNGPVWVIKRPGHTHEEAL
jgi:hypothetical protein